MNEREALLRAICTNPDDDTPRLVFADWLQENGDEARAEFIRLQIERARSTASPGRPKLAKRADQLLRLHGPRWSFDLPEEDGFRWATVYSRGFIEQIALVSDGEPFLRCYADCFDSTPLVTLRVSCAVLDWQTMFDSGHLARVRSLHLPTDHIGFHAAALCAIGPWPNLVSLSFDQLYTGVRTAQGYHYELHNAEPVAALRKVFGERVAPRAPGT